MGERPTAKPKLDLRAVRARIAQRRRDVALAVQGMLPSAPDPEEPGTDPAIAASDDPPGAPPRVGRIADVEHVDAPYQPPLGASRNARPRWTADGENTGRLVLAEVEGDAPRLPPTLEIALPEVIDPVEVTPREIRPAELGLPDAARSAIPETRQIVLPEAAERTAVIEADALHTPTRSAASDGMPTPAEARSAGAGVGSPSRSGATKLIGTPPPRPQRGYERTAVLSEAQLRGEEPVQMRRSLYDEVTFVLPASALEGEDDGDDEGTQLDVDDRTER